MQLALALFLLLPTARAVSPAPDGGYRNFNTAEGDFALHDLSTGTNNTAIGADALFFNSSGNFNTATGSAALEANTVGSNNTADGLSALVSNTQGSANTAMGTFALADNAKGNNNTALGVQALLGNRLSNDNTAIGVEALLNNDGNSNTASGVRALSSNISGSGNTANGVEALANNSTGDGNIALGRLAGANLTTGNNNIDIGNRSIANETATIRIGTRGTHTNSFIAGISGVTVAGGVGVIIDSSGHLGTVTSSERFKEEIRPMEEASEAILALKPVSFRYKHELDPAGIPQFGLVAEQVEKVNPDLVARDEAGKPYTVRYDAINAMLLNEFLKEHRKVQEQQSEIVQLRTVTAQQQNQFEMRLAQQQKQIEVLTAGLRQQAAQIQNVSDQLKIRKSLPLLVVDSQ